MNQLTIPTEDMFLIVFCLIDDLYQELVPDSVKQRPGSDRIDFNDSEVIALSVLQEAHANDSETSFHRLVEKDYRDLFPDLLERSRYHRRRKALLQVQLLLLRHLMDRLKVLAAWLIIDSAPIETTLFVRSQSAQASIPEAAYGYCPSKKRHFFGFRLHVLVSNQGAILDFVLAPADVGERAVAAYLLVNFPGATALGDNGYSSIWLTRLFGRHGGGFDMAPVRVSDRGRRPRRAFGVFSGPSGLWSRRSFDVGRSVDARDNACTESVGG